MTLLQRLLSSILCIFVLLSAIGLWLAHAWTQEGEGKKLIYYGWGVRDTQYVRDHWRQMEEMPFDGVGIVVAINRQAWQRGEVSTGNQLGWQVMGQRLFREEEFCEAVADLKAARWRAFTDNFLPAALSASQSAAGLNWFDEERWRIVANNFRVLARIAAEGGARGILLDPEHYSYALFNYPIQRQRVDRPFGEYVEVARRRGRQVMTAIAAPLPDAVLLSLFGYTLPQSNLPRMFTPQNETSMGGKYRYFVLPPNMMNTFWSGGPPDPPVGQAARLSRMGPGSVQHVRCHYINIDISSFFSTFWQLLFSDYTDLPPGEHFRHLEADRLQ